MTTRQQTAEAFAAGKPARCHNARTDGFSYTLHNTVIARHEAFPVRRVVFNWGGFHTVTTAAHMRDIRDALPHGWDIHGVPSAADPFRMATARDNGINEFSLVWKV